MPVHGRALERYTIPIVEDGVCVNIRKYRPGPADNKMISYGEGYGTVRLWPLDALRAEPCIVLLEGEPDTLLGAAGGPARGNLYIGGRHPGPGLP